MERMITPEVRIGRLNKKMNKLRDQRNKATKELEHYKEVLDNHPYIQYRHKNYTEMVAERQRVKDLEVRVKEQAELIRLLQKTPCYCYTCADTKTRLTTMILCPNCGNKRCPKATDHNNACTNSNEVGQEGSRY